MVPEKMPTNYIQAMFVGPRWTNPDFVVARVGMSWLAAREFDEVRTKRNLSYAPTARFTGTPAHRSAFSTSRPSIHARR